MPRLQKFKARISETRLSAVKAGDILANTQVGMCGVVVEVMRDGITLHVGTDAGTEMLVLEDVSDWYKVPTPASRVHLFDRLVRKLV